MKATQDERCIVAAEMLINFIRQPHRIALRVYGLFQADALVSWTCSKSCAKRMADSKYWQQIRVQYIGTVGPLSPQDTP